MAFQTWDSDSGPIISLLDKLLFHIHPPTPLI